MEPKLSVVIPVYNSSKTLYRCVESLQKQTMKSLEIILVDDGSTDTSGDICDGFASKDERIYVIHQENKGALLARVAGCKASHGEYISFVDSDDWIDETMFEALCPQMDNVDMLASGICRNAFDGRLIEYSLNVRPAGRYDLTNFQDLEGIFFSTEYVYGDYPGAIMVGLWGKIFLRKIVLKYIDALSVRIREGEDWLFIVLYILHSKSIRVIEQCYYHYCSNINSVTHTSNLNYLSEQNEIYKIIKQEISGHPAENVLIKQIQKRFMYNIISDMGEKMEFDDEVVLPKWSFPSNELLINSRVVLFGAGNIGQSYLKAWKKERINVVCWVDNVPSNVRVFDMIPEKPEIIMNYDFDYVVCGVKSELAYEAIKSQLLDMGIDKKIILWEKPVYIWMKYLCN